MKHNIDALVERVRAVANRPTTPGSHIDWAGDDDESLPDLDDWGVTTGTSAADKDEKISPILEDTLKPLPEPISKAEDDAPSSEGPSTSDAQGDLANGAGADAPPSPSKVREEETIEPQDTSSKDSAAPSTGAESTPRTASIPDTNITAVTPQAPKPALHPSLPAKPVVTVGLPPARNGATPMRDPSIPLKPRPAASPEGNAEETSVLVNGAVAKPDIPAKPELDEPGKDGDDADGEQGLHASIHAPKESVPRSSSAPSHITAHPIPTHPRSFSPAHTRSHTVGRPINGLAVPGSALNPHFRSGANSPRAPHHARTHSSPPTGPPVMGHRAPHATRPVITGDAISRLARTIGGSGMRSATVASKD
ncbi:hypothetical protein PLICRDRAFT_150084 [Plicaturopsis crispa FD-325 SS-3]|nr:hypothetical protein PLICRDRAFT_150084 [Plicaturopsis crispa FD-325 SS-3]